MKYKQLTLKERYHISTLLKRGWKQKEIAQYIHENPVKRGYVDNAIHWRYSSARDYEGTVGLIEVERFW